MKKILIGLIVLTMGLSAYTFEENKKACDDGDPNGCYILGDMYDNGLGVKQDHFKAVKLYTKSCDAGIAQGCNNLGVMYYKGEGCKQDISKAQEYFRKACKGGIEKGCTGFKILNNR